MRRIFSLSATVYHATSHLKTSGAVKVYYFPMLFFIEKCQTCSNSTLQANKHFLCLESGLRDSNRLAFQKWLLGRIPSISWGSLFQLKGGLTLSKHPLLSSTENIRTRHETVVIPRAVLTYHRVHPPTLTPRQAPIGFIVV